MLCFLPPTISFAHQLNLSRQQISLIYFYKYNPSKERSTYCQSPQKNNNKSRYTYVYNNNLHVQAQMGSTSDLINLRHTMQIYILPHRITSGIYNLIIDRFSIYIIYKVFGHITRKSINQPISNAIQQDCKNKITHIPKNKFNSATLK